METERPTLDPAKYWDRALIKVINGPDKGRRGIVTAIAADTLTVLELPFRNLFFVNTSDAQKVQ